MTDHAVLIVGSGPTGLMLAGELALAGVNVAIVERRESQELSGLRARGLHIRTIEMLDQRGIADRFISRGKKISCVPFALIALDVSDMPTRHNYFLALWQIDFERILAEWVGELAVPIYRGFEVIDFAQHEHGVDIELSDGRSLRANYLVGCDGGRSVIRKKAKIDFPGWEPSTSYLIAEVELAEDPEWGIRRSERGINALARLADGSVRLVLNERDIVKKDEPALSDIREALIAVYGTDYGLRSAKDMSRFNDMTRQAAQYRNRRVLLAGDAAHVHSPVGGQGLNLGVQDAMNLGWKLSQVVHGTSPESLLDTYHAERHPVGVRVLRNTMAITAIDRGDDRIGAMRELMSEMLQKDEIRRQYVAMISGLDIRYDLGEGHPLLGRRMPDLDLITGNGPVSVFTVLHQGRGAFISFDKPSRVDLTPWAGKVKTVTAKYEGIWTIPGIGAVTPPSAMLIRPDGYVAWVGDSTQPGLLEALTRWFGSPTAP